MSDDEKVVYFEDIEASSKSERPEKVGTTDVEGVAKTKKTSASSNVATSTSAPLKRQRTLMEMMSGGTKASEGVDGAQKSTKKQKTDVGAPTNEKQSATSSEPVVSELQLLNSTPFSLSSYKETLTDETRELLQLECETMGLSWWV
jgi:uracil-DNA glycosylase